MKKIIYLKKLYIPLILCFIFTNACAQSLVENFSYTAASAIVGQNSWAQRYVAGTGGGAAFVSASGLIYSGYNGSNIGNALTLAETAGEDIYKNLSASVSSGSVYVSFMLKVNFTIPAGGTFLGCATSGVSSVQRTRVYIRTGSSAGTFNIGLAKNVGSTITWAPTSYTNSTTYLIALKYTFNISTSDDTYTLWVNPLLGATEDPSPVLTNISDAALADLTSFGSIVLYQGGWNTNTAGTGVTIDGLKVSTLWADILTPPNVNYYYKGTGSLNTLSSWGINADGTGTAPGNFTDVSQSFNVANTTSVALSGSWVVSGANSKIVVPILDTLKVINGASIGSSTVDVAGALTLDNFTFPTFGAVSGSILIDKPSTIILSGASTITLPNFSAGGDFIIVSGNVDMVNNDLVVNGKLQINGSYKISGGGNFTLNATGLLRIAHPEGIVASVASSTGSIQFANARSFDAAASYNYIGSGLNLETGTGLPTALTGTLTIRLFDTANVINLTQSLNATPIISMSAGLLKIGNNNITLSSMVNGSTASYVITDGTGTISRSVLNTGGNATTAKSFFVGTQTEYRLIRITFPSNIGTPASTMLTLKYVPTNPGSNGYSSGIGIHSPTGYWNLGFSVAPTNTYTLSIETKNMQGASNPLQSDAQIIRRVNGASAVWEKMGTVGTAGFKDSISGTSLFAVATTVPASAPINYDIALGFISSLLPVKFLSITASKENNQVRLKWTTANELDNRYFNIQRSADGLIFKNIGKVEANLNGNNVNRYDFMDIIPLKGIGYYRVQQVDINNQNSFSSIVSINFFNTKPDAVSVSPNPIVNGTAKMSFYSADGGQYELLIQNTLGKTLYSNYFEQNKSSQANYSLQLPIGLAKGMYFMKIVDVKKQTFVTQKVLVF